MRSRSSVLLIGLALCFLSVGFCALITPVTATEIVVSATTVPAPDLAAPGTASPSLGPVVRGTVTTLPIVITTPGTYTLDRDYTNLAGLVAIDVRCSDVVIDGGGHILDGTDATYSVGVQVHGSAVLTGVTVKNIRLTDWDKGIYFWNARGRIEGVTASSNTNTGIMLYSGGDGTSITGCTAENNGVGGFSISYAPGVDVSSCTARNNANDGFYVYGSNSARINGVTSSGNTMSGIALIGSSTARISGALVSGCQITANGKTGIYMSRAEANTVVNNRFENTVNTMFEGPEVGANTWNTAKTAGTNIVGGAYLGGNWWSGFSETASDGNGDGFADQAYGIGAGNNDALPLVLPATDHTIRPGMVITAPGTYTLEGDLYDSEHAVIVEIRCSNVVIQGNGHQIYGSGTGGWCGVFVNGQSGAITGVTIRDLGLNNCYYGIYLYNADASRVERCRVDNTPSNGMGLILAQGSTGNTVTGNGVFSGYDAGPGTQGIVITSSSQNTITNNEFCNPVNVVLGGTVGSNTWNSAKIAGVNIVGGPNLGGNYWAKPDGTGWSEQVADSNHDGIGDSSFVISSGNTDYLPLVFYEPPYTQLNPYSYKVNLGPGYPSGARVDGDNIVWTDYRSDPEEGSGTNNVTNSTAAPRTWEDFRNADIYLYNLATGRETPICVNAARQEFPDVSGNRIVWSDHRNGEYRDLYYYDLTTGQEHPLCTAPLGQYYPYIKGNRVVWLDYRGDSGTGAYLYDFSTGQERRISSTEYAPVVDGDRVLFKTDRNCPRADVYMYNIATQQESLLTYSENSHGALDVSGDYAVYTRTSSDRTSIVLHHLGTGMTKTVVERVSGVFYGPVCIDGDRIFWQEGTKTRIYQISTNTYYEFDSPGFSLSDASGTRMVGFDGTGIMVYSLTPLPARPPTAAFTTDWYFVQSPPMQVTFSDLSIGEPTSWRWDFGDGSISTARNPSHTYMAPGKYTVTLTVTNAAGSDTEQKAGFIQVRGPYRDHRLPVRIEAEDYDYGGPGVAYYDTTGESTGGGSLRNDDVDISSASGTTYISQTEANEWLEYTVRADTAGVYQFRAYVRSYYSGRTIMVSIDGGTATALVVPTTYGSWTTIETLLSVPTGTHVLRLEFGGNNVELDAIEFAGAQPAVTSITPNTGTRASAVSITNLVGTGFQSGAAVRLTRSGSADIVATNVMVVSPTKITCQFAVPSTAATGAWNVVVTNPNGQSGTLPNGFMVALLPLVTLSTGTFQVPNVGGTVSVPIVLSSAPGGLSGYRFTVRLSDPSIGTITAVTFPYWAGLKSSSALPSGQVLVQGVDTSKQVPVGGTNVILATLTVRGSAQGSTDIMVTLDPSVGIQNRNGELVPVATIPGVLTVSYQPYFDCIHSRPKDLDRDGKYEDVNGNGRADFSDIVILFNNLDCVAVDDDWRCLDFNNNGRIDFADVTWLFNNL